MRARSASVVVLSPAIPCSSRLTANFLPVMAALRNVAVSTLRINEAINIAGSLHTGACNLTAPCHSQTLTGLCGCLWVTNDITQSTLSSLKHSMNPACFNDRYTILDVHNTRMDNVGDLSRRKSIVKVNRLASSFLAYGGVRYVRRRPKHVGRRRESIAVGAAPNEVGGEGAGRQGRRCWQPVLVPGGTLAKAAPGSYFYDPPSLGLRPR